MTPMPKTIQAAPEQPHVNHGRTEPATRSERPGHASQSLAVAAGLARWLVDGQRLLRQLSEAADTQTRLEAKVTSLERATQQLQRDVADLRADRIPDADVAPSVFALGWFRAALALLILAAAITASGPYWAGWFDASPPTVPAASGPAADPGRGPGADRPPSDLLIPVAPAGLDDAGRPEIAQPGHAPRQPGGSSAPRRPSPARGG